MFVGLGIILTGVDIEHGANASPGQQGNFALSGRLRLQLNLGVTVLGKRPPAQQDSGMRSKKEKKTRPWAVHNRRKAGSILYREDYFDQDSII